MPSGRYNRRNNMSAQLFSKLKHYLIAYADEINKHSLGDERVEEIQVMVDELSLLLKSDEVQQIEQTIADAERKTVSDDLAQEILNARYCVGGSCDD
jgi:hypothetical protein